MYKDMTDRNGQVLTILRAASIEESRPIAGLTPWSWTWFFRILFDKLKFYLIRYRRCRTSSLKAKSGIYSIGFLLIFNLGFDFLDKYFFVIIAKFRWPVFFLCFHPL